MASSLDPRIIVLALGAAALGFPDALCFLVRDVAGRSPLTDIAICVFAIAVVTAQALGATLLARFVRKAAARAGGDDENAPRAPTPPRTDGFAQVTLVVSLGVAFLVSACLLVAPAAGADGIAPLYLAVADDVARKTKNPVTAVLATGAAVLLCTVPLLRVFHQSHAAAAAATASRSTGGGRAPGNAIGSGGRASPTAAADTRRFGGKLTRLAPYMAVVSFAVICLVFTSLTAPRTNDST